MTIDRWFEKNIRSPLLWTALLLVMLWIGLVSLSFNTSLSRQKAGFRELVVVSELVLAQKNLSALEGIFQALQIKDQADSIAICRGGGTLLFVGESANPCGDTKTIKLQLKHAITGSENLDLVFVVSYKNLMIDHVFSLLLLTITLGAFGIILFTLNRAVFKEIFETVKAGIFSDSEVPILEFEKIRQQNLRFHKDKLLLAVAESNSDLAKQVSHDIRSPLSALNLILDSSDGLEPDKKQIIKMAVKRINGIASDLLIKTNVAKAHKNDLVSLPKSTDLALLLTEVLGKFQDRCRVRVA